MSSAGPVLVVGSANVDITARVSRLPGPGETVLSTGLSRSAGGKGLNQAIAASRAGATVDFRASIGVGSSGDELLAQLSAEGICVAHVQRPAQPPGTALVVVDERGENQIVVDRGANAAASESLLQTPPSPPPRVVLVQCEIPLDTVDAALHYGRSVGATTILNAAPASLLPPELVDAVDILVVNEHEYATVLGRTGQAPVDCPPGWPTIVLTVGAMGAIVLNDGNSIAIRAPKVTVVDTVAAGDAFCGFLAAALARGDAIEDAVHAGCVAGALTVTRSGAAASVPTLADLQRFQQRNGIDANAL